MARSVATVTFTASRPTRAVSNWFGPAGSRTTTSAGMPSGTDDITTSIYSGRIPSITVPADGRPGPGRSDPASPVPPGADTSRDAPVELVGWSGASGTATPATITAGALSAVRSSPLRKFIGRLPMDTPTKRVDGGA